MNRSILFILILLVSNTTGAAERMAILDFELSDITSLPNTPEEKQRTASIRPLLEQAMRTIGGYEIISIDAKTQTYANSSVGYLFQYDDLAAKLGAQAGVDWIIVGRHSKPSFLYSHLMLHLIQVKTQTILASLDVELKGNHQEVTKRGVNKLAEKIHSAIQRN